MLNVILGPVPGTGIGPRMIDVSWPPRGRRATDPPSHCEVRSRELPAPAVYDWADDPDLA